MTTETSTRIIRLTKLQMQLLLKADKPWAKANVVVAARGKDNEWVKLEVTPAVAQLLMDRFTSMSKAKTSPIRMKLHQHAVCAAAARYIGDLLAGGEATVAVLASKQGQDIVSPVEKLAEKMVAALDAQQEFSAAEHSILVVLAARCNTIIAKAPAAPKVRKTRKLAVVANDEGPAVLKEIFKFGR